MKKPIRENWGAKSGAQNTGMGRPSMLRGSPKREAVGGAREARREAGCANGIDAVATKPSRGLLYWLDKIIGFECPEPGEGNGRSTEDVRKSGHEDSSAGRSVQSRDVAYWDCDRCNTRRDNPPVVPLSVSCCTLQLAQGGSKVLKMVPPTKETPMMNLFRKQFPELG
jgi:hypothetical protein